MSRFAQLAECPDLERVKQKLVKRAKFKVIVVLTKAFKL